jgi:L-alanine-DL-glutamate epimerase-like enolase superfamily enzyme
MHDRPAVLVRVEDNDGNFGWGEIWCNFPSCGAEHRHALCETVIGPHLLESSYTSLEEVYEVLTAKTLILSLQTREFGPITQVIAGVMGALWDLESRKINQPLFYLLNSNTTSNGWVPSYASGINSAGAVENIRKLKKMGYTQFKVKIGFDFNADIKTIENIFDILDSNDILNVDVNQAWSFEEALDRIEKLGKYPLGWIEEPIASNNTAERFAELNAINNIPIAGGENIYGVEEFAKYTTQISLGVIQPDACKWGGPAKCLEVATNATQAGAIYCPHFLGAGIGLWTSAHILAAAGGPGVLEIDVNYNPLQSLLGEPRPVFVDSGYQLSEEPGIGVVPNLNATRQFVVKQSSC